MNEMDADDYFQSYENLEVHELMLKDAVRNRSYQQAIIENKSKIEGKTVLDVGAGTGILSIFCAQAGAAKVYAVEASNTYKIAQDLVDENHVNHIIKVIHSKVEDVVLPVKVDVIVSEWMGFYLLHESMLDSVLIARDKFLKPNGLIFPESVTLYAAPCSVPTMFDLWWNVNGVKMQKFAEKMREERSKKPQIMSVKSDDILAEPEIIAWIDLREVKSEELDNLKVQQLSIANKSGKYQGICLWFSCLFPSTISEPIQLTTDPNELETHWKQTVIVLPKSIDVEDKEPIAFELSLTRFQQRKYNIELTMLDPDDIEHPEYCLCHKTKCILVRALLEKYEIEQ